MRLRFNSAFLKNSWFIGISTSLVAFVISSIAISLKNSINIINGMKSIIRLFISVLSYDIQLWIIISVISLIYILARILKVKALPKPEWLDYTQDKYDEYLFKWTYRYVVNKYEVEKITPVCERCYCELSNKEFDCLDSFFVGNESYSYCPNCENQYRFIDQEVIDNFKKIIFYRIESETYKEKVSRAC